MSKLRYTHKIISVPHSGTRSLRKKLFDEKYEFTRIVEPKKPLHVKRTADAPAYHFYEDSEIIHAYTGVAHIPLRDPFAIMLSWESRRKKVHGRCGMWLIDSIEEMVAWTHNRDDVIFYLCNDLPENRGRYTGPRVSPHEVRQSKLWKGFVKRYEGSPLIRGFYRDHFEDLDWT